MPGIKTNIETYNRIYQSMDHAHAYPNVNLVRLDRWFLKQPGQILDHGCGYGENLIFLASRGYQVTGVDVSRNLLDYVEMKCRIRQVPPTLYKLALVGAEEGLPFPDRAFDHVISLGVLEMMGSPDTARLCLAELARCLKPNGKMIVSTLAPENSFALQAKPVGNERFRFAGQERDKGTPLEYDLYIPENPDSFARLFPADCRVQEIGSWDNDYCNVKGKHYVALVSKSS